MLPMSTEGAGLHLSTEDAELQSPPESQVELAPPVLDLPPLPAEVYEHLPALRVCVCVMYILSGLRLLVEPFYFIGALLEFLVAVTGSDILRHDSVASPYVEDALRRLPDVKAIPYLNQVPIPRGMDTLIILCPLCVLGTFTEIRHTLYMGAGYDASSLWILIPFTVYGNALLYFAVLLIAVQMLCVAGNVCQGVYRSPGQNPHVAHASNPDTSFSDEEDMRRAIEASRREAMQGLTGAQRMEALGIDPATAGEAEEDQVRRAQEASRRDLEEARLRRQAQHRAAT